MSTLSLISCTGTKTESIKTELTVDNIKNYLSIDDKIIDYTIEENYEYIYGYIYPNYDGSHGEAQIIINKKSANFSFEDVKIRLKVSVSAGEKYPWEFKNNNYSGKDEYGSKKNYTYINCSVPYTGEYTENLNFVIGDYNEDSKSVLNTTSLSYIFIEIVSVSGYVIEEQN